MVRSWGLLESRSVHVCSLLVGGAHPSGVRPRPWSELLDSWWHMASLVSASHLVRVPIQSLVVSATHKVDSRAARLRM